MLKHFPYWFALVAITTIFACRQNSTDNSQDNSQAVVQDNGTDHLVMSVLWYQRSSEMRAAYYQAFNMARLALDKNMQQKADKPHAIVVDIDECVLDNSPFEGKVIETDEPYSNENWKMWTDEAIAKALPGAVDFLNYAHEQGVAVFYISNRNVNELESTIKNLKSEGFPNVDTAYIHLKSTDSNKTARRAKVSKNHEIILLIGDNLMDFSSIYDDRSRDYGFAVVDSTRSDFGTRFIILPNPMYGHWEKGIYGGSYENTKGEKKKMRLEQIKSY